MDDVARLSKRMAEPLHISTEPAYLVSHLYEAAQGPLLEWPHLSRHSLGAMPMLTIQTRAPRLSAVCKQKGQGRWQRRASLRLEPRMEVVAYAPASAPHALCKWLDLGSDCHDVAPVTLAGAPVVVETPVELVAVVAIELKL
jgi:hypothetical protein